MNRMAFRVGDLLAQGDENHQQHRGRAQGEQQGFREMSGKQEPQECEENAQTGGAKHASIPDP